MISGYLASKKKKEKSYCRGMIALVGIPYAGFLLAKKGIMFKLGGVYLFSTVFDAIYDTGMYLHFFFHGPNYMRQLLALEDKSFAAIQLRLFLRFF